MYIGIRDNLKNQTLCNFLKNWLVIYEVYSNINKEIYIKIKKKNRVKKRKNNKKKRIKKDKRYV